MTITRSEHWYHDRGFNRDVCAATVTYRGRTVDCYLFDTPMLAHEFQRTAVDRVPLLIDVGGDTRVCGYTWPIYITREDLRNVQVTR